MNSAVVRINNLALNKAAYGKQRRGLRLCAGGTNPTRSPSAKKEAENTTSLSKQQPLTQMLTNDVRTQLLTRRGTTESKQATNEELYFAVGYSIQQYLFQKFLETQNYWKKQHAKQVYYLSAEFLVGRALSNTLVNLNLEGPYAEALAKFGRNLEDVVTQERDASLGNGGLGRLAACYVDSMASCDLPGWGYGIRYEYGMFRQKIINNRQTEHPDPWNKQGYPFEMKRENIRYQISFGGRTRVAKGGDNSNNQVDVQIDGRNVEGSAQKIWEPTEVYIAQAYDNPQPGYKTETVGNIRLWDCLPVNDLNLSLFNEGKFAQSVEEARLARQICSVLYPNDSTDDGKKLRLKQQYFFVSASIQDALNRFVENEGKAWDKLPEKMVFQLNDTHPAISISEMLRCLVDIENIPFNKAWDLTKRIFNYTNHTVLPEALEKWPVQYIETMLPRNMELIKAINQVYLDETRKLVDGSKKDLVEKLSIIHPNQWNPSENVVNMAYLSMAGSQKVNGVAAIHSDIIKAVTFETHAQIKPDMFMNVTNGVTTRRWLRNCNPELSQVISETLGSDKWVKEPNLLQELSQYATDGDFQSKWQNAKRTRKNKVLDYIEANTPYTIANRNSLLDIQIKRIHEYKRQFMNVLSIIYRHQTLKQMSKEDRNKVQSRTVVIAGKAASSYENAKRIIGLTCDVGKTINNDPDTKDKLQVFFLEDYNVSLAELLVPGSELSQHISTAGTEASGTSNMKFTMNGCLIIGTLDGANVEINQEVGEKNIFIFGNTADKTEELRKNRKSLQLDQRFVQVCESIIKGQYGDASYFRPLVESVYNMNVGNDYFLVANDFASYLDKQEEVDQVYQDQKEWTTRSINCVAKSGFFSSDRAIREYGDKIWGLKSCIIPYQN